MELDQIITYLQGALSRIPRSHPAYTAHIYLLAKSRSNRYQLSEQKEDLDKSILHYTESIFLPPSWGFYLNVVQVFFQLVLSLFRRSKKFKQPEDAKCVVEYLRYLRGLPLDTYEVPHEVVTKSLVEALGIQVELEAGETRDIEEMVILCQELLTCHSSANHTTHAIDALVSAILCELRQEKQVQPLDGIIKCLRDALKICPPGLHPVPLGLAVTLIIRYRTNFSNGDYDEAMTLLESVIASRPQFQIEASVYAATLACLRVSFYPNPEYLEEAISRFRTLLGSSSLDNDFRYGVTLNMESLAKMRFENFGLTEALQEARYCTSEMANLAPSLALGIFDKVDAFRAAYPMTVVEEKIRNLRELISKTPPGNSNHNTHIEDLANWHKTKFSRTRDIKDLEELIKYRRVLLASTDTSHPFRPHHAFSLGSDLHMAFECSNTMEYLDESITVSDRFALSCFWASIARSVRHPSISAAYQKAMSLMQVHWSPRRPASTACSTGRNARALRNIPLDYASYQIDMGQLTQAIETLERGRALLWSEMRGLRNSMDQLSRFNSPLAMKLAAINQDLESLTMSVTPSGTIEISNGGSQVDDGMDPFGRLVIQELPGFGDFLKTLSFENICVAASQGPVVIINHSEWRSDILILVHGSPPSLIPTTNHFYRLANELKVRLVVARRDGLDSDKYKRALRSVLEGLYKLVGRPVIDRLRALGVPEQSRIWWYLYIPSYTPTLSALIESRKASPKTSYQPSLLLVANPDESLPGAIEEWQSYRISIRGTATSRFAHFVCHGILETGKPFDASFKLFDDERLTLLDIMKVCGRRTSPYGGVQYCGFRSVVGTMWEMADIDRREIAENFYKSMFSGNGQG
ncbi:hypothetical protein B0F90DRAFT_1823106 [Multifurca ochricompacta]|uniref:CHAT domain-containing protein n=1 Tax=Multifurca ochricompacta TaxID=376703 RepID=A0AAD4LVY5_9AGAM|nr:hypothetical protein B0F90DRAFT_1823106 [Multifurca ochricompacta]